MCPARACSSVKVSEFDKPLKKAGGHIGRSFVEITIKIKTIFPNNSIFFLFPCVNVIRFCDDLVFNISYFNTILGKFLEHILHKFPDNIFPVFQGKKTSFPSKSFLLGQQFFCCIRFSGFWPNLHHPFSTHFIFRIAFRITVDLCLSFCF